MTPEEAVALLLDIARKGMVIDALRQRCSELEAQVAALPADKPASS